MTPYGTRNKYKAKKVVYIPKLDIYMDFEKFKKSPHKKVEYILYDSQKEAKYAELLDGLKKEGKIKGWTRQVRFPLPDLNWLEAGSKRSYYAADFVVTTLDGREHIVEVKGVLTDANKIKYAFVQYIYERPIHIVRTTGLDKMNFNFLECKICIKSNSSKLAH